MFGRNTFLSPVAVVAYLAASTSGRTSDWHTITPSRNLTYYPCYGTFQCARLLLPLDWKNENTTDTVSIAMIKLPAAVPEDHPAFGGAILTNPGGPGISGIDDLRGSGHFLQSIIDIPGQKHYEYISFDPRGIGASEPQIDCYPANDMARQAREREKLAAGAVSLGPASLVFQHSLAKALGKRCEKTNAKILPFVNTPSVARDMVAMVDKIAELRQRQATRQIDTETQTQPREATDDVARLQFIGFSYGTILGNYFASLFPGRVGRMVLDGVADSDDYANGPGWLTNTQDTDKMMDIFFEGCFNAGSRSCQLRRPGDKTPADISNRTWSWINSRDAEPIHATSYDQSTDVLLRSAEIRMMLFASLYHAHDAFFSLASLLAQALEGNTEPLIAVLVGSLGISNLADGCTISNDPAGLVTFDEPRNAVMCADGDDVSSQDSNYWKVYTDKQQSISSLFGDLWTPRLDCSAWRVRPNWQFKGPFRTPAPSQNASAPEPGRPAAPLLFLSSKWDPVTPLRNARSMASLHPGAGVLVANSMGHTLFGSGGRSECSEKVVSEYFDKGIVPKGEVLCEVAESPWDGEPEPDARIQESIRRRTRHNLIGV